MPAAADSMPLVSVVIPTYNRAPLLRRAVESALCQSHAALEVLVVDDASGDQTERVMAGFSDSRVRYLRHPRRLGGSAARNTALDAAAGDYVAFLDDDDEWMPRKIERQLKLIRGCDAVICGFRLNPGDGEIPGSWADGRVREITPERLRRGYIGWGTSTLMVRRRVLEGLRFDPELPAGQDWDLLIRISARHRVRYIDEPLVVIGIGNHPRISTDVADLPPARLETRMRVLHKHRDFLGPFWFRYHAAGLSLHRVRERRDAMRRVWSVVREYGAMPVVYRFLQLQWQRPGRY